MYCLDKLAELAKKHQLQNMLNDNERDLLDNSLNKDKILSFIKNADCCSNCCKNKSTKIKD